MYKAQPGWFQKSKLTFPSKNAGDVWECGRRRGHLLGERSDLAPSWSAQTLPFLPRSKSTGQHQVLPRSHFLHKLHRIIEIIITIFIIILGSSPQLSLISYGHWSVLFCGLNGLVWSQHARVHDIHLTALHPDIFVFRDKHRASSYLIKSSSRSTWLPSSANFLFCPRPLHKLRSTAPCTPDPSSTILGNVSQTSFWSQRALSSGPWEDFKKSVMKVVGFGFTLWCLIVKVVRETKKDPEFSDSLTVISKHWDVHRSG